MMLARVLLLAVAAGLAACGGSDDLTCDDGPYLESVRAPRVQAPEDLDNLESIKEMPLPAASPRPARSADAPCLDRPPTAKVSD